MGLHNDVGNLGEYLVKRHLSQVAPCTTGKRSDLRFEGVEVEVKTSRATLYNGHTFGYQFLLSKDDQYGKTDFRESDVLVLLCLDDDCNPVATFVVPTREVRNRTKITIPLSLKTRFAKYRDRWGKTFETVLREAA